MDNQNTEKKSEKPSGAILDNIGKILPVGYVFLVFCGALYIYFYYLPFNVDIFRYLELSEIAVLFLPIMINIVMFLGYVMVYFVIIKIASVIVTKKNSYKPPSHYLKFRNFLSKREIYLNLTMCCICAVYLFHSYLWLSVDYEFNPSGQIWWWFFLILSIVILSLIVEIKNVIINLALLFIMLVVHQAIHDFKKTRDSAENQLYTIITEKDTLITDGTSYFIGRTNNYIFLYNASQNINYEIPVTQIKKFSFKNLRNGGKWKFWKDLKNKIEIEN